MPANAPKYLRPEDARQLRPLSFSPRVLVEGTLSGKHRSRLRGASTEFHEFRPYSPGDPPALVDWRVFARTDRFYLKTFEQETHLECHLFVDASASMAFADSATGLSKFDWAAHFAAGLAYLVTLRQDRVSLTLFENRPISFLPPGGTQSHLRQLLQQLEQCQPKGQTGIAAALEHSLPLIKQRGTILILSDFLDDHAALFRALSAWLHRGFKVICLQVLTPEELQLPDSSYRRYVDMETGQRINLHPDTVRSAYQQELANHQRQLSQLSSRRGIEFQFITTGQSWVEQIRNLAK
jgi:uncharacterized protein (DUF58 family)